MGLKSFFSLPFAKAIVKKNKAWQKDPVKTQNEVLRSLISEAKDTAFGRDHQFSTISGYVDFKSRVPVRDYEGLKHYIDRIQKGESDVLWKGLPIYLSKTSGTTSGAKYIPITKESIKYHVSAARNAILTYIAESRNTNFVNGKMIFLQGSPKLDNSGPIPIGRLSGIVAHHVPAYLQKNRMPTFETNCIEDWEEKVDSICEETLKENMTLISGIPPWVQMYFEKLLEKSNKANIKDIFPNFSLFIYGGVNYEPYRNAMQQLIGKDIDTIELYPASEGFIAYQDSQSENGMLLLLNSGMFYEFIEADKFFDENPERLSIGDVELGKNYVLLISSNAGLWAYNIGDTVRFVSLKPHRLVVSGRIKHFTSAFGEHVIAEEVESAMAELGSEMNLEIVEFHLAPKVEVSNELPYHEWFIEFKQEDVDINLIGHKLDDKMRIKNPYYKDLIEGKILQPLKITPIRKEGFKEYMNSIGKLGGQNKLPRLANDRKLADQLNNYSI